MTTLADAPLSTLTAELAEFLGLPAVLDLPELAAVQLLRRTGDTGWQVIAQLGVCADDPTSYEQIRAWSALGDGAIELGPSHPGGVHGTWRKISTSVSFVGVQVTVWAHVAGSFEAPPTTADLLAAVLLLETAGARSDGAL